MNPRVDLSKSSRFTIWEGGRFNPKASQGSAYIIGGPEGQELEILFVADPKQYQWNCCFPVTTGVVIAYAHVIRQSHIDYEVSLELARVEECVTDIVQGEATPRVELKPMYVYNGTGHFNKGIEAYKNQEFYKAEYANMLQLAVEKALTVQPAQKHFFGRQRVRSS